VTRKESARTVILTSKIAPPPLSQLVFLGRYMQYNYKELNNLNAMNNKFLRRKRTSFEWMDGRVLDRQLKIEAERNNRDVWSCLEHSIGRLVAIQCLQKYSMICISRGARRSTQDRNDRWLACCISCSLLVLTCVAGFPPDEAATFETFEYISAYEAHHSNDHSTIQITSVSSTRTLPRSLPPQYIWFTNSDRLCLFDSLR